MMLWEIEGQVAGESSGGCIEIYAFTASEKDLPDPDRALAEVHPDASWSMINEVRRVGWMPMAWSAETCPGRRYLADLVEVIKATESNFGPDGHA